MTAPTERRGHGRHVAIGVVVALLLILLPLGWLGPRSSQAASAAGSLAVTADLLRADASRGDIAAVARGITTLKSQASLLHELTGGPLWAVATHLPVVGARASAAREIGSIADRLATAAAPLADLLPRLDNRALAAAGGRLDVAAIAALGPVLTTLATSMAQAAHDIEAINRDGLSGGQVGQLASLRNALVDAKEPLSATAAVLPMIAHLLGSDGARTWFVALQNLAEARGNGGIVGAYALLHTDSGKVTLVEAASRKKLDAGPRIPDGNLPQEFRELWGGDATLWADMNLSPHFPYSAQLILNGWAARGGAPLDGVVAIDQNLVAALLSGTGPVTVRGISVDAASAVQFLTRDVYARFPVVADKDAVVVEFVQAVFMRLAAGQVSLAPLLKALRANDSQGHFMLWSARGDEQMRIEQYSVAGVLPDTPGPFAMAVINNGAGNKLDAYTEVTLDYRQGQCAAPVRTSQIHVTVHNSAPASGLPAYVQGRLDLPQELQATAPQGSNKVLLSVYGTAGSTNGLTTVDGEEIGVPVGLERGHPVWRVDLVLLPGQTRTVDIEMIESVDPATAATVGVQPMAIPQVVHLSPCTRP
ncbi:unannotated protein [freshwater metagenome]|uniref:Unannotated protein n=1 Tax=freshwater metagenome TaxID=449393 RepID=A0A6J7L4K7_9ZZZZ|nr:DUF4012 domain-containing protein [Actinomycetota bacterium]